jgi:hypothetical protein
LSEDTVIAYLNFFLYEGGKMGRSRSEFIAFIRSMYVSEDIRRTAYWMDERYKKPEFNGSTLWLVTGRENKAQPKDSPRRHVYSLVARLRNCKVIIDESRSKWRLKFQGDESSEQYASNNVNFVLLGLQFDPMKQISKFRSFGGSLQKLRKLSDRDADLLHEFSLDLKIRPSVFLSYSRADQRAEDVQNALEASGIPLFRDVTSISYGTDWKNEISKAIRQSRVFLYLHSPESMQSEYVLWEIEQALRIQQTDWSDRQRIPPILIMPVPMRLQEFPNEEPFLTLLDLHVLEWGKLGRSEALASIVADIHRFLVHETH